MDADSIQILEGVDPTTEEAEPNVEERKARILDDLADLSHALQDLTLGDDETVADWDHYFSTERGFRGHEEALLGLARKWRLAFHELERIFTEFREINRAEAARALQRFQGQRRRADAAEARIRTERRLASWTHEATMRAIGRPYVETSAPLTEIHGHVVALASDLEETKRDRELLEQLFTFQRIDET